MTVSRLNMNWFRGAFWEASPLLTEVVEAFPNLAEASSIAGELSPPVLMFWTVSLDTFLSSFLDSINMNSLLGYGDSCWSPPKVLYRSGWLVRAFPNVSLLLSFCLSWPWLWLDTHSLESSLRTTSLWSLEDLSLTTGMDACLEGFSRLLPPSLRDRP